MVSTTPTTLGDLRDALIERCQLDPADPRATAAFLNPIINESISRFDMANPQIWPWDAHESGPQTLDTATSDPVIQPLSAIGKVRYILLGDPTGTWLQPLERMTREQQLREYPLDDQRGRPMTYALLGYPLANQNDPTVAIFFRPLPDVSYRVTWGSWLPVPLLVSDADPDPHTNDYMLGDWSSTALEYAAHLVYRGREDLSEAQAAKTAFDGDIVDARRWSRRTYGAGIPGRPGVA